MSETTGAPIGMQFIAGGEYRMADPTLVASNTQASQQAILERAKAERLYVRLPDGRIPVNCGDGRFAPDLYGKKFGGRLGLSWDYAVLAELAQRGAITRSWAEIDADLTPALKLAGIDAGVHSDEHAEGAGAKTINMSVTSGDNVGCKRVAAAEKIADAYGRHIEEIIVEARELAPSLVTGREDRMRQLAVINVDLAHRKMPDGRPFIASPRELMLSSMHNGAPGIVLPGDHHEFDAIYNTKENETNDNRHNDGHLANDGWVTQRFFKSLQGPFPFDLTDAALQDVCVTLASKLVITGTLGDVAVRS